MTIQLSSAIGGAAIAAMGIVVVFGLDMASFWISALAIMLMMRTVPRKIALHSEVGMPPPRGACGPALRKVGED